MKAFLLFITTIFFFYSCNEQRGCSNIKAFNYDPTVQVADGSCTFPDLEINFSFTIDSLPFEINRIYNIDGYNTAFKVFQCYLSNIQLKRSDQSSVNYDHLYPLIKKNQSSISLGQVNMETFEELSFNIGLDPISNNNIFQNFNSPGHPLALQVPDTMHFDYTNGYIFLKIVGKVDRNGDGIPNENEAFNFQIGTNQLLRSVRLAINKQILQENERIELNFDLRKLLHNVDLQTEKHSRTLDNLPLATKIADNIADAIQVKN